MTNILMNNLNDWLFPFQILLGPNTGMSGGMPGMMPPAPGKMWETGRANTNLRSAASDTAGAGRKERQRDDGEGQRTAV